MHESTPAPPAPTLQHALRQAHLWHQVTHSVAAVGSQTQHPRLHLFNCLCVLGRGGRGGGGMPGNFVWKRQRRGHGRRWGERQRRRRRLRRQPGQSAGRAACMRALEQQSRSLPRRRCASAAPRPPACAPAGRKKQRGCTPPARGRGRREVSLAPPRSRGGLAGRDGPVARRRVLAGVCCWRGRVVEGGGGEDMRHSHVDVVCFVKDDDAVCPAQGVHRAPAAQARSHTGQPRRFQPGSPSAATAQLERRGCAQAVTAPVAAADLV